MIHLKRLAGIINPFSRRESRQPSGKVPAKPISARNTLKKDSPAMDPTDDSTCVIVIVICSIK